MPVWDSINGCGLYGTAEEQSVPGQNNCMMLGSCATPINAERFSTDGPNTGKSVWLRAREVFKIQVWPKLRQQNPNLPAAPPAVPGSQSDPDVFRDAAQEDREGWIDFMVDLARYEYSLFTMFDAPGHEGKPWADVETDDDRLALQPCFALHSFRYPVASYYQHVRLGRDAKLPRSNPHLSRYRARTIRFIPTRSAKSILCS